MVFHKRMQDTTFLESWIVHYYFTYLIGRTLKINFRRSAVAAMRNDTGRNNPQHVEFIDEIGNTTMTECRYQVHGQLPGRH